MVSNFMAVSQSAASNTPMATPCTHQHHTQHGGGAGITPPMHQRLELLGIVTTQDLEALFDICDDTVTRAYKRGDIPPPIRLFGCNAWTIEAIQQHLARRLEEARVQAEREHAQRDTKVAALYGGQPHGRRS